MHFHVVTIHPDLFASYLSGSMLGRALSSGIISVTFYNPRAYTTDKHKTVDDRPYGGGPGMVMMAEPILKAVDEACKNIPSDNPLIYFFTPSGHEFTTECAKNAAEGARDLILICGHYEGVDARVLEALRDTYNPEFIVEKTIGPYVLTGGELPAMVVIDAISRFIPGVLGTLESNEEMRIASSEVYTRPEVILWNGKEYNVPDVLLSGNHKEIEEWRKSKNDKH